MTEYRSLRMEFEYSAEYKPGELNIELQIQRLKMVLYIRMLNGVLNEDLESRI